MPGPDLPHHVDGSTEQDAPQDTSDIRHLVDNIERRMAEEPAQPDAEVERSVAPVQPEPMETSTPADGIERALDVSMNQIDLSQAMPPKELLLEEPPADVPSVPIGTIEEDLDLGPPGDAAAFFGVDHPMPVSDRSVLDRLRGEFPSLARPSIAGWFEELEVAPLPTTEAMPPPSTTGAGISASTPIVPNPNIRRFYNTDLSAIKPPALAEKLPKDQEQEQQVGPTDEIIPADTLVNVPSQDAPQSAEIIAAGIVPESVQAPTLEPAQDAEPISVQQVAPIPQVTTPAAVESSNVPAPVRIESSSSEATTVPRSRRSRNIFRKVPTYTENSIPVTMKLRTVFEYDFIDNLDMYEQSRALIQCIIESRPTGTIQHARTSAERLSIRPSLPNGIEEHPVMRDVSATQAELSSIREPTANQSKLYPIQERPQHEEREEQQLQGVPVSVPIGETTLPPVIEPVIPSIPALTEVPLDHTSQMLDTGLGNQMLFPDSSVNISAPQIIISDTSTCLDTGISVNRETPSGILRPPAERPSVQIDAAAVLTEAAQVAPVTEAPQQPDRPRSDDRVPQPEDTSHNEMLISILKLYLTQQREMANTKQNAITINRLAQITNDDRMASARRFKHLLTLKTWGFIELETGDSSQLSKIALR